MLENIPTSKIEMLNNFLNSNNSTATLHTFDAPVHSVEQASQLLESSPDKFIKTICLESKEGDFVSVIVLGSSRVDTTKVQEFLNLPKLKPASKESIALRTGFEVGGIPLAGYESIFVIDNLVILQDEVFGGGGDDRTLLKITPSELLRLNEGKVIDCSKI